MSSVVVKAKPKEKSIDVQRELTSKDIQKIAGTCHARRGDALGPPSASSAPCEDVAGFCRSATLDDIRHHNYVLSPGRYVGAEEVEDDGVLFEGQMSRLTVTLREQTEQADKLDKIVWANLEELGYGE